MLQMLGERYSNFICDLIKSDRSPAVYLFHAVDWLESSHAPELASLVPALKLNLDERLKLYSKVLASFAHYRAILLEEELLGRELISQKGTPSTPLARQASSVDAAKAQSGNRIHF